MNRTFLTFSNHRFKIIAGIFLALSLITGSAEAQESWWKRVTNLLKGDGENNKQAEITIEDIGAGLKEALRVGSENVVARLGRVDGFNADPTIHIPLPKQLAVVKSGLDKVGMAHLTEDLELKLNRAAEVATPKAKKLFRQAVTDMSFDDVKAIYEGPEDAATQYFRSKMSLSLAKEMQPVVQNSLAEVKAIQAYDKVMEKYRSLPFVPDVKADLTNYVIEKGIDGIFYYMAREEAAIRRNPAKRTTDLLKRVFGAK